MNPSRILLIVGGGIAAYKSCELIRLIRRSGSTVQCVLTSGGAQFITPMTLAALSENPVHTTLWDLTAEAEMGHIQLSRQADLVVICPASADLLARMAQGIADDLATTLLLATDKPVLAAPAMNVRMWEHAATRANVATLRQRGVAVLEPDEGPMACGEFGAGRLPEPVEVWQAIAAHLGIDAGIDGAVEPDMPGLAADLIQRTTTTRTVFVEDDLPAAAAAVAEPADQPLIAPGTPPLVAKGLARAAPPTDVTAINHEVSAQLPPEPLAEALADDPLFGQPDFAPDQDVVAAPVAGPLHGRHVLITAGPTHEAIDPVRYIANRSSGKQGFAIAAAAAAAGARVTLVAGPVTLPCPPGVDRIDVESAEQMAEAVKQALPADVAVMVAAVADWRVDRIAGEKIKKRGSAPPALRLTENPDILATVATGTMRPKLVVGFAAETERVIEHAKDKRKRKGADWIVANDVSGDVMGGASNTVHIVTAEGVESLPKLPKDAVAQALVKRIADVFGQ